MAKRHRSKRGIPCGNVVSARLAERFGNAPARYGPRGQLIEGTEIVGQSCKLLIYLSPAQTARNRRDFDRFCQRTGMKWNPVDVARCAIEVSIDISYVAELERADWCSFAESVIDAPVPIFARGDRELSESASRFAKLNRHQQAHGIERHKFGVDRAPRRAKA